MDALETNVLPLDRKHRQSNIELLRILAMVMIVAHHLGVHSDFDFTGNMLLVNRLWIHFLQMGGKIGVNLFVLISGYFLVTASSIKPGKAVKLWLQMLTYSVVLFWLLILLWDGIFDWNRFLGSFSPFLGNTWWFASTYFVLYLLSPFVNIWLKAMPKKTYQQFLLLLTLCWCVIPTFLKKSLESNSLLWFLYLYALAGYLRLHFDFSTVRAGVLYSVAAGIALLTFLLATVLYSFGVTSVLDPVSFDYLYGMQQLPILLISVALFVGVSALKVSYSPVINIVSSATFGVYLIHDYGAMRAVLWQHILKNWLYEDSVFLIPYTIAQVIAVFSVCTGIELLRIYLVERFYAKRLDCLTGFRKKE